MRKLASFIPRISTVVEITWWLSLKCLAKVVWTLNLPSKSMGHSGHWTESAAAEAASSSGSCFPDRVSNLAT